jgi:hypothetical protein
MVTWPASGSEAAAADMVVQAAVNKREKRNFNSIAFPDWIASV